jgi:small conductance mechanosensitive channel
MNLRTLHEKINRTLLALLFSSVICILLSTVSLMAQDGGAQEEPSAKMEDVIADTIVETGIKANDGPKEDGLPKELLDPAINMLELEYRLVPLTKGELEKLAGAWLSIVKKKTEEVMAAQIAVSKTENAIEDAVRRKLVELTQERRTLFDKYAKILQAWEKKGADKEAVAEYRAYQNAIIVEETRAADYKTLFAQAKAWLFYPDGGIRIMKNIAIVLVSMLGLLLAAKLVTRIFDRWIDRMPNLSKLLKVFLVTTIYWLVLAFGLMVVLSALGIDVTPVFALIGGASFILAFAFQDTLGNLASGLMIMINRPFDQGDYVEVGGVGGTVQTVSIVATKVVTPDNQLIVIPNKNVWGSVITNVTASQTRRVDLVFGISYEDSIPEAARLIEETVAAHPLVLDDPAPVIRVHELADSSVNFICRPWAKTSDYWTVYWDLTRQVKERFDAEGISIPYPQHDLHIYSRGVDLPGQVKAIASPEKPAALPKNPTPAKKAGRTKAIAQGQSD